MNVNSVMNTYNLTSLWNNLKPSNTSSASVPMTDNIESTVKELYTSKNYSGQTSSTELQDIYKQVEPDYGIPLTYNQDGSISIPTSTDVSSSALSTENSNIISLLNSGNSDTDNSLLNILSQYNSIESGTFKPDASSILSSNPSTVYNAVNSLANYSQSSGSNIDTEV